jgi:hypothetical protein
MLEPDSKVYIRARRLTASWMLAIEMKAASVSARFSKSLASLRLRPNQENVRSTTQRRGSTNETLHVIGAFDDLDAQARDLGYDSIDLVSMVAGIGPDQLEPRKAVPYPLDHPRCAIAVLNAR